MVAECFRADQLRYLHIVCSVEVTTWCISYCVDFEILREFTAELLPHGYNVSGQFLILISINSTP